MTPKLNSEIVNPVGVVSSLLLFAYINFIQNIFVLVQVYFKMSFKFVNEHYSTL